MHSVTDVHLRTWLVDEVNGVLVQLQVHSLQVLRAAQDGLSEDIGERLMISQYCDLLLANFSSNSTYRKPSLASSTENSFALANFRATSSNVGVG